MKILVKSVGEVREEGSDTKKEGPFQGGTGFTDWMDMESGEGKQRLKQHSRLSGRTDKPKVQNRVLGEGGGYTDYSKIYCTI